MSSLFPFPLADDQDQITPLPNLDPINPRFFIPSLVEKPQEKPPNPILDTLKLNAATETYLRLSALPKELAVINERSFPADILLLENGIWVDVLQTNVLGFSNQIHSWDNLNPTAPKKASSGGFLSEQDSIVFAAAQHQYLPILQDSRSVVQYIPLHHLLSNLKLTALGFSSSLHEWDSVGQRFIDSGLQQGMRKRLIIEGKDENISAEIISRFIHIGMSLRRLEYLISSLRSRPNIGPTAHAFAHTISTCLEKIRQSLAVAPPSETQLSSTQLALTPVLMYYAQHQEVLIALCQLCKRQGEDLSPGDYEDLPTTPPELLTLIYEHLHDHMERQSSHLVIATFAFILTHSCKEYFRDVSRSIGFGGLDQGIEIANPIPRHFPSFFPSDLVNALPIAQKSLRLLRSAQPSHPLLQKSKLFADIRWVWTSDEAIAAVEGSKAPVRVNVVVEAREQFPSPLSATTKTYLPELSEFRVYDLIPGSSIGQSCFDISYSAAPTAALEHFIKYFPPDLPTLTPTLAHLTALVVRPLLLHATTLSNTLLSLFLSLPPPLDIHSHLHLMRSYILLMSSSFRARLSSALFSDTGDFDADAKSSSRMQLGRGSHPPDLREKIWAVGLATALLGKAMWPPMDTDLSFFLRTVILDSFEVGTNEETRRSRAEEIENRLGFAVRDLSTEPGQDAWMNPLHIEALDFLYMDYKPPQPLDVIITSDISSKYQRIFTFLLRVLRVQHAIHAAFRMSGSTDPLIFETLTSSRKMMLHFRFIAQSFVTNLVEYIYDTAIAGNLDPFLVRLKSPPEDLAKGYDDLQQQYSDVFSLSEAHSNVMDTILSACLLRTAQKTAGGVLRDALELVLDFAILVGELYRGRMEEYRAAPVLDKLYSQFRGKMRHLTRILNATVDKNVSSRGFLQVPYSVGVQDQRNPIGGVEALSHLLIRLDLGEYWVESSTLP